MGVVGSNILAGSSGAAEAYTIDQSLRFNIADSAYLSRTPGSAGNRRTWTWSGWIKRGNISVGTDSTFFSAYTNDTNRTTGVSYRSDTTDVLDFYNIEGGVDTAIIRTSAKFRDPSAWYHVVYAFDSTQSTASDRLKIYINGESQDLTTTVSVVLNSETSINSTVVHSIGTYAGTLAHNFIGGYLAEVHFIDGTALDASSFGETDADTNQWKPIEYTGSYGTNGFYQKYGSSGGHTSFTSAGTTTWTVPAGITSVDYLVVGGGGSGGSGSGGGGGGAGAYRTGTLSVTPAAELTVTVGAGGAAVSDSIGNDGGSSVFSSITSGGGGGGGATTGATASSGSGGGGGNGSAAGGSGSYGYDGGSGGTANVGGGGGGASAVGTAGVGSPYWGYGHGGAGTALSITGSSVTYAGGGGGGVNHAGAGGNGGAGGGGGGAGSTQTPSAGTANTGGGGGGATSTSQASGAGGSGIVIIKPATGFGFGLDSSGEGNNFTATNLVATDQMIDSPTNNWCTWSPLASNATSISEGNLKAVGDTAGSYFQGPYGTFGVASGKWYWETYINDLTGGGVLVGISPSSLAITQAGDLYAVLNSYTWRDNQIKYQGTDGGSTATGYGATYTNGDIIGVALDMDGGTITFYKNNSTQGEAFSSITGTYSPISCGYSSATFTANFGQDSSFAGNLTAQGNQDSNSIGDFYYEPPTDYLALCTSNLASPEIALPGDNFNTKLYTGDGATTLAVSGVGFQPDFTWIKNRSATDHHVLVDSVRGATKYLVSNDTGPEVDDSTFVASLDSDGFTVGDDVVVNTSTENYVSWNWLAGGTAVSNTDGSITSSVSANTDAGFSIVSWTAEGAIDTIGHGLSQKPELIIIKDRDGADESWVTGADPIGWTKYLTLNSDAAENTSSSVFNDTSPSSSVFTVSDGFNDTQPIITYCFHSVEGYSKVGSYEGNGNADGPFIYTGFKPAWILVKNATVNTQWDMWDNKRDTYNLMNHLLQADNSSARITSAEVDFVSDGFKVRSASDNMNDSGETLVYLAFAESPFKYSNAR